MKEQILNYIKNKDLKSLKKLLVSLEEMELFPVFVDLSSKEQVIVFRLLPKILALFLFEQLDTGMQHNLVKSFNDEEAKEFINEMTPDDRVRLFDEMPVAVTEKLLNSITPTEREQTNILMGYDHQTAGRIMTTKYISLRKKMTVEEALAKVRKQANEKETIYTLFVTNDTKKLEGVISLKELLVASSDDILADIMNNKVIKVTTDTDQEEVAKKLKDFDILAVPVIDKEERLDG